MRVYVELSSYDECASCGRGPHGQREFFPYQGPDGWAFRCEECRRGEPFQGSSAEVYAKTWSGDWWKKHWFGVLGIVLLASYFGWERGTMNGSKQVMERLASDHPSVLREWAREDSANAAEEDWPDDYDSRRP